MPFVRQGISSACLAQRKGVVLHTVMSHICAQSKAN